MECKVNVKGGVLPQEEINAYIQRARQKFGTEPQGIDITVDGEYVERMSFLFDLRCVLGTFFSVLRQSNVREGAPESSQKKDGPAA